MTQFYVSYHGPVVYLCLRDENHPWYGYAIKRLKTTKYIHSSDVQKLANAIDKMQEK